jgi:hypothetical protein
MKTVLWSVGTDDWKGVFPADPLQGTTNRMAPGGISLQHDTQVGESVAADEAKCLIGKDVLTREVLARNGATRASAGFSGGAALGRQSRSPSQGDQVNAIGTEGRFP